MQLEDVPLTREASVKIERGIQHILAPQFRAIRNVLEILHIYPIDNNSFIAAANEFEEERISFSVSSLQSGICESILILCFFHKKAALFSGRI